MNLLRLIIGIPLIVLGLVTLLGSVFFVLLGKDAVAASVIMGVIGLALIWAGRKFAWGHNRDGHWRADPASNKQKSFAREMGIKFHPGISKGELSDKISEALGNDPDDDE